MKMTLFYLLLSIPTFVVVRLYLKYEDWINIKVNLDK